MVKKEQSRTCIVTRESGKRDELIRFVIGPEENVVPDIKQKLPGRGVWVTNSRQAVQKAYERNLFAAGFKKKVNVSSEISQNIDDLMVDNIHRGLSMAKKSGLVITGFSKVEALARKGEVNVLFHARDGKEDGLSKIESALFAANLAGHYKKGIPKAFTVLGAGQLDIALGMSNTVHVALIKGGASSNLKIQIRKLDEYRAR